LYNRREKRYVTAHWPVAMNLTGPAEALDETGC